MKDIHCLLNHHSFSEWIEVENHLERECLRGCGEVQIKYPPLPPPSIILLETSLNLAWNLYLYNEYRKGRLPLGHPLFSTNIYPKKHTSNPGVEE